VIVEDPAEYPLMEKVKAAIDPNPFVEDLGGGLSRRGGIFDLHV